MGLGIRGRHALIAVGILGVGCVLTGGKPLRGHVAVVGAEAKYEASAGTAGWTAYNGGRDGDHYSHLTQINKTNVGKLRQVWRLDAGKEGGLQANPLIVGRMLYGYTSSLKVFAVDGTTGHHLWEFDSGVRGSQASRGFTYWEGQKGESRLFVYIMNFVYALDPKSGKPISSFGEDGRLDMRKDLGGDYTKNSVAMTTPGVLYKNLLIVGFRAPEAKPAPRGDIRAYDVLHGKLMWSFHTIPHPGEEGYKTWPDGAWRDAGAANNWAGMALDERRGIVYVPTGSAATDFYGADRVGDDLFANSLLALDAATGKKLWHFQGVHHDIWDRDFPSPPALVTVRHEGKMVDAVAQTTKQGFVYLFDRVTGRPLFPIEEHPFPLSNVPGEITSPTQPVPRAPAPFARQMLTEEMLTRRTPAAHAWAVEHFKELRSEGQFVPFSVDRQTVVFPGFDGGAEWGGPGVDPRSGVIYINSNDIAWTGGLAKPQTGGGIGAAVYRSQCSVCHGDDRKGSPPAFPSLVGIGGRLSPQQVSEVVHGGRGRMPAFPAIGDQQLAAVIGYLCSDSDVAGEASLGALSGKKELDGDETDGAQTYRFTGYRKFLDPDGYPAIVPPWGTLNAIDLNTGRYLWKIPLGSYPALAEKGMLATGSENYGGPVVTASGLLFIGATIYDRKIRAFDTHNGELMWEAELPFSGVATPATYMIDGRQYIVIAASGQRDPKGPQGAAYIAFALP